MAVRIDHLALAAHDARESARFLADVGGRGLSVDDPAGHHVEVITRRYGSGG
ncbi:MAG: hypothetical protein K0S40_4197 [Actinomycetospora sp.]|jgi:hypothetical protein|nr:hypothetical protein [Actinomycetospora sp.]